MSYHLLSQAGGIILFWKESDPNCGTGKYRLNSLFLSLSATADNTNAILEIRLFNYYPGPAINESNYYDPDLFYFGPGDALPGHAEFVASISQPLWVGTSAGWVAIALGASFVVDVNASSYSVLTWKTTGREILWNEDYSQVRVKRYVSNLGLIFLFMRFCYISFSAGPARWVRPCLRAT